MDLIALVAATPAGVIGRDGDMPWRLSSDLRRFKRLTLSHAIIMGRKTFDSIGRPLPGRRSLVLTRDATWSAEGVDVYHDVDSLLASIQPQSRAFVVGGGEIYRLLWDRCNWVYLTRVLSNVAGDTTVPAVDPAQFALVHQARYPQTERDSAPTEFEIWQRR